MLDVVDGQQREILVSKIKPYLPGLKKYTYGKHLISSKLIDTSAWRRTTRLMLLTACLEVEKQLLFEKEHGDQLCVDKSLKNTQQEGTIA